MEIKARPVAKFGEGNGVNLPLVRGGPPSAPSRQSQNPKRAATVESHPCTKNAQE
jgi:hypothetical protein